VGCLIDTSVWLDHFRERIAPLASLIRDEQVIIHPFVTGELTMGSLRSRQQTIDALRSLPQALIVSDDAWQAFVEEHALAGTGIGFVDAHLLASAIGMGALLWTRDKRLRTHAQALGCCAAAD
jgi:predicted nucleic acid-binding protein